MSEVTSRFWLYRMVQKQVNWKTCWSVKGNDNTPASLWNGLTALWVLHWTYRISLRTVFVNSVSNKEVWNQRAPVPLNRKLSKPQSRAAPWRREKPLAPAEIEARLIGRPCRGHVTILTYLTLVSYELYSNKCVFEVEERRGRWWLVQNCRDPFEEYVYLTGKQLYCNVLNLECRSWSKSCRHIFTYALVCLFMGS